MAPEGYDIGEMSARAVEDDGRLDQPGLLAAGRSGGEAEIAGEVGMRRGAATRSLRSARRATDSVAPRVVAVDSI
jgi:hypothetical protein